MNFEECNLMGKEWWSKVSNVCVCGKCESQSLMNLN